MLFGQHLEDFAYESCSDLDGTTTISQDWMRLRDLFRTYYKITAKDAQAKDSN